MTDRDLIALMLELLMWAFPGAEFWGRIISRFNMETSIWWLPVLSISIFLWPRFVMSRRHPCDANSKDEYDAKSPAYVSLVTFTSLVLCIFVLAY